MSLHRLKQQLARDLARSPKKAAMLALLAAVAIYFWAPLAVKLFRGGEATEETVTATATAAAQNPMAATDTVNNTSTAATPKIDAPQSWQEVMKMLEQDPRRKAMPQLPSGLDPFAVPEPPQEKTAAKAARPLATKPRALGLTLNGTLLGPRKRWALINGKTYAEGEPVAAGGTKFVVRNVQPREVTLEGEGQAIVLKAAVLRAAAPEIAGQSSPERRERSPLEQSSRERDEE